MKPLINKKHLLNNLLTASIITAALALLANTASACQDHADTENGYAAFLAKTNGKGKSMEFLVPSISCMSCAYKIKKALKPIEGVHDITVDADTHKLRFKCDNCDLPAIKTKLKEIGYPVTETT